MKNRIFKLGLVVCVLLGLLATGVHAAQAATASVSTGSVAEVSDFALNQSEVYAAGGSDPLKVLLIGNSFSRDSAFYLGYLAKAADQNIQVAYLHKNSATLRHHAKNLQQGNTEYSYWLSDSSTGALECEVVGSTGCTIQHALDEADWDVVCLQQGVAQAGFSTTYNADLDYLVDYIRNEEPGADLYWNLTWACDENTAEWGDPDGPHAQNFRTYYNEDQKTMYNAIVDCFEEHILDSGKFVGWFPTGAAIQNLRNNFDTKLTRDGYHLSLAAGRLTAAMTLLKTLCLDFDLDLDLQKITLDEVSDFLVTDHMEYGEEIKTDPEYENSEENLKRIREAVEAATADLDNAPARLSAKPQDKVESAGTGDFSLVTTQAPMKLHFPDITVLGNGTALVAAYENVAHSVTGTVKDENYAMQGAGRLLVWASRDDGTNGTFKLEEEPLLVVDEKKLEEWGIVTLARTKAAREEEVFTFLADARDPNFGLVYTNVDGDEDGTKEEVLLFTFWVRTFTEDKAFYNDKGAGLYLLWGTVNENGTVDWAEKPQQLTDDDGNYTGLKRGDIASFSDGTILVPTYVETAGTIYCLNMSFDPREKTWSLNNRTEVTVPTCEETERTECSFVAPDPDEGTVYAFVRDSGVVLKSEDRGQVWELVANEDGDPASTGDDLIEQPGFAIIDKNRVFATWSKRPYPRDIWGKMFYVNEKSGWDKMGNMATRIYTSLGEWPTGTSFKDTGDPSAKLMPNGDILVVHYDTAYRAIVGTWVPLAGVTVTQTGAGTVSVDKDKGLPGETVTVTANADEGSSLNKIVVTEMIGGEPRDQFEIANGETFTIKDGDAEYTVWAQFVVEWESFEHSGYFIDLKSSLGLTVYLNLPLDGVYTATAVHNGESQTAPLKWNTALRIYEMTFEDIAAKEMRDTITFIVYEGEEKRYMMETSVYDAAVYMYDGNESQAYRAMLADMLAYGAAAQVNWNYNLSLLENEDKLSGGSDEPGLWVPTPDVGTTGALNGKIAATLSLEDRIELNVYVNDPDANLNEVNFTGAEESAIYTRDNPTSKDNTRLTRFKFDALAVKDVKGVFELGIELKDGTAGTVRYSISDYVLGVSDSSAQKPLLVALQKYVDSVINYFVLHLDNITADADELRVYRIVGF